MKLSFCIINRCIHVEYGLYECRIRRRTEKKVTCSRLWSPSFPSSLELRSITDRRHWRSSIPSSVRECASPLVKHASFSSMSHDVNYRFWMSSSSNYSGADLHLFLYSTLYLSIYLYKYLYVFDMCPPFLWAHFLVWREQTSKYPYRWNKKKQSRSMKVVLCAKFLTIDLN